MIASPRACQKGKESLAARAAAGLRPRAWARAAVAPVARAPAAGRLADDGPWTMDDEAGAGVGWLAGTSELAGVAGVGPSPPSVARVATATLSPQPARARAAARASS